MRPPAQRRRDPAPAARRAFTLVELVTAASLMTIIMLGVIEIFAIVTQTASDAEGVIFAQEQARGFFDRLHNELRGMTREGYLRIVHNTIVSQDATGTNCVLSATPSQATGDPKLASVDPYGVNANKFYSADSIAFVTLGMFAPTFPTSTTQTPTPTNPVAEVLYTNNVITSSLPINSASRSVLLIQASRYPSHQVDPRRGILARGQWLLSPGSASYGFSDVNDLANGKYLGEWLAQQPVHNSATSSAVLPAIPYDRISRAAVAMGLSPTTSAAAAGGYVQVMPWIASLEWGDNTQTLKRVVASCCSEFYVEIYDPAGITEGTSGGTFYGQGMCALTSGAYDKNTNPPTTDPPYFWSTNQWPSSTIGNTITTTPSGIRTWPKAIRVTIALHDPSEHKPLDTTQGPRFRGLVMQETFWITDP